MSTIPVIDVSGHGATSAHQRIATEIDHAFREVGFAYVRGHGISSDLQQRLFDFARKFFAESDDEKLKIKMQNAGRAWRGYFPFEGELTVGVPDQKEGLYFGAENQASDPGVIESWPMHGKNQFPDHQKYRGFRESVLEYIAALSTLGQNLMQCVALGLNLNEDYFLKRFSNEPTTLFRIFNYPALENPEAGWGVAQHTDMGFLTILLQDDLGGLEVLGPKGEWLSAPPVPDSFIINIGDMLQFWTHGIYRATLHRVRNTASKDRLSLPFFFDPNWNSSLTPIDPTRLNQAKIAALQKEKSRWDGRKLSELSPSETYGSFVWSKIRDVFPELAN